MWLAACTRFCSHVATAPVRPATCSLWPVACSMQWGVCLPQPLPPQPAACGPPPTTLKTSAFPNHGASARPAAASFPMLAACACGALSQITLPKAANLLVAACLACCLHSHQLRHRSAHLVAACSACCLHSHQLHHRRAHLVAACWPPAAAPPAASAAPCTSSHATASVSGRRTPDSCCCTSSCIPGGPWLPKAPSAQWTRPLCPDHS